MKTATVAEVTVTPVEAAKPAKAIKKSGNRIGYNYIIVKSLKESQKNDVVKCLYIKSLTNFGFCVIKEGSYGDTKDKEGRDIKDRLLWQQQLHIQLQGTVRIPRLLGSFEENGNYYLVIERIKGKPLLKACKETNGALRKGLVEGNKTGIAFIDYLIQIVDLLNDLHQQQVVHRDATSNNFIIMPNGKVAIIDMELSYSLKQQYPSPPFKLGTHGYMSPEQLKTAIPTIKEDIFAMGAVILQVWTGISPSKLTDLPMEDLRQKIYFLVRDQVIADSILQCLQPDPSLRSDLATVRLALEQYKKDSQHARKRKLTQPRIYNKDEIQSVIQSAINTLASPLMADAEKGWFSKDNSNLSENDKKRPSKAWHASFNTGAAGIIYFLSKAYQQGYDISNTQPFIQKGIDLIEKKYLLRLQDASPAIGTGSAGIAASLASCLQSGLLQPGYQYTDWINLLLDKENMALDYKNGISGQGIAYLLSRSFIKTNTLQQCLTLYADRLSAQQQPDGSWISEANTKKLKKSCGFNRGGAGIVYFLLEYTRYFNDKKTMQSAQRGLFWLMQAASGKHQQIHWLSASKKNLSHWLHEGTAGIAFTFIRAYAITGELKFKELAMEVLYSHPEENIDNDLSQGYGLSGLGEVYLEAFRVFKDEQWLQRAGHIAQLLIQIKRTDAKYGPYWLVQHEEQPIADFSTGNSGVLHFLLRYCSQPTVDFPLLP